MHTNSVSYVAGSTGNVYPTLSFTSSHSACSSKNVSLYTLDAILAVDCCYVFLDTYKPPWQGRGGILCFSDSVSVYFFFKTGLLCFDSNLLYVAFCFETCFGIFFKLCYLFIYLWLHWVFIAVRRLSLVAVSGGYSLLWCMGLLLQWLLLLRSMGSRHTGFSSCGSRALERRLSSCGTRA